MYSVQNTMESLEKYDISRQNLLDWESALGLDIPVDTQGQKLYSPHHINLFKNVKKHIALGRTLDQIKKIITLPPISDSKPDNNPTAEPQTIDRSPEDSQQTSRAEVLISNQPLVQPKVLPPKSPYASVPHRPKSTSPGAAGVVELVQRLTSEKDHLYRKLLETEKLNSHLYSANNMYHRRVKEQDAAIAQLRDQLKLDENLKLRDDKARLHGQLIEAEKLINEKENAVRKTKEDLALADEVVKRLESRIESLTQLFDPSSFCGDWMETGHLVDIVYDNFGVNIEAERVRLFRISKKPDRTYGRTAVITTTYQYETNTQWKRQETLVATWTDAQMLEGEVTAEYILDGVPVAKALYRVSCRRNV